MEWRMEIHIRPTGTTCKIGFGMSIDERRAYRHEVQELSTETLRAAVHEAEQLVADAGCATDLVQEDRLAILRDELSCRAR